MLGMLEYMGFLPPVVVDSVQSMEQGCHLKGSRKKIHIYLEIEFYCKKSYFIFKLKKEIKTDGVLSLVFITIWTVTIFKLWTLICVVFYLSLVGLSDHTGPQLVSGCLSFGLLLFWFAFKGQGLLELLWDVEGVEVSLGTDHWLEG